MEENTEKFPQVKEVVPSKLLVPGMEFAYVKSENLMAWHEDGWRQITYCNPFVVEEKTYVVMRRGTPIGSSEVIIPKVVVNEPPLAMDVAV